MDELRAEVEGSDVAEARARALEEIRRQAPWVEEDAVRLQVVEEGERGLLGIGARPARVVAFAQVSEPPKRDESELAVSVRDYAERVVRAIGAESHVELSEDAEGITVLFAGGDLGVLIGRRGQTIEAIEQLANAIVYHQLGPEAKRITADAGGYRERQKVALSHAALQAAKRAISSGERQTLEQMSPFERRLVHERLKEYPGVTTTSEGTDPNRYVVVLPADEA
jgi:spoIIIJ-associated protein